MERLKKQLRFRAVFYSISRHCPEIESLAPPPWRGAALRRPRKAVQSVQHAVDTASTSPSTVPNVG